MMGLLLRPPPLALLACLALGLQWALWAVAAALRTEKFYDLAGSGTFILLAYLSLKWGNTNYPQQQIQTGLVTIWGLRLVVIVAFCGSEFHSIMHSCQPSRSRKRDRDRKSGKYGILDSYDNDAISETILPLLRPDSTIVGFTGLGLFLFLRILKEGHDRRFNGVRENPAIFFLYWTIQGIWVFITLLPTLVLNLEKHERPLGFWNYFGWSTWAVGFITEAVADLQKWHFRSHPDNAGRFIQSGLWAYSRHPNYFGEIVLWTGLFLSAVSVLHGWQYLSVLSPLLVWFLLSYVSGIPLLEKAAMRRWGKEAAFQAYLQRTPVLWPVSWKG